MHPIISPDSDNRVSRNVSRLVRCSLAVCLLNIGIVISATSIYGITYHPPMIGWIPDQAIPTTGPNFATKFFRATDNGESVITKYSLDCIVVNLDTNHQTFYNKGLITVDTCAGQNGCPQDGFKIQFGAPNGDGNATVTVTVTDGQGLTAATSFTLRQDSTLGNDPPPKLGNIPNEQIQVGTDGIGNYDPVWFVADDTNASGLQDSLNGDGSTALNFSYFYNNNPIITSVNVQQITSGQTGYKLTVKTGDPGVTATRATVTVSAWKGTDTSHQTSTSFVLDIVPYSNKQPGIAGFNNAFNTFVENTAPGQPASYAFKVASNDGTPNSELLVTATSSNASLVPNDSSNLSISTPPGIDGVGTLTVTSLPLPTTQQGSYIPQAATITLAVTDDVYTRRAQFLYVAKAPGSPFVNFSRPTGVYNLDPQDSPNDQHRQNDLFLTGEMHRISWGKIDNGNLNGIGWDWTQIDNLLGPQGNLPEGQAISLNLVGEPDYIVGLAGVTFWCDSSPDDQRDCPSSCGISTKKRPVPWDATLQFRFNNFLDKLAHHPTRGGRYVYNDPRVLIINPNLPGADVGIRDVGINLSKMCGYTRVKLRNAVTNNLQNVLNKFPANVQIGFFIIDDDNTTNPLWKWLYQQLSGYFNGNIHSRVSFFQEDLAAARLSAAPDFINYGPPATKTAYTFTPDLMQMPSFFYYCSGGICTYTDTTYNNSIVFQANTIWSGPFGDYIKTEKTLNGTPNDGMEAAFDAYYNQYLEVYTGDLDHAQAVAAPTPWDGAKWKAGLDSWHDYTAHVSGMAPMGRPAGLTVTRASSNNNTVSWEGVYGATYYTLQSRLLSPLGAWANVKGCDPLATSCADTATMGSQYAYRVQASDATGKILSLWANVAVFLSESKYDGYVAGVLGAYVPFPGPVEPGIQAGQGLGTDISGFLSFDTTPLGSAVTVLGAKLRLRQYTDNKAFDSLGTCMVDIQKGDFNSNVALEALDFTATQTASNIAQEGVFIGVDAGNWLVAQLDPAYNIDVNTTDRTQLRTHFNHVNNLNNLWAGWYSGDSIGNEPELLIQYSEP